MNDPAFRNAFLEAKELLNGCGVAVISIENPIELYLFEAYYAMELDTAEWNTFRRGVSCGRDCRLLYALPQFRGCLYRRSIKACGSRDDL